MIKTPIGSKGEILELRTMRSKTFDMGGGNRVLSSSRAVEHVPNDLTEFAAGRDFTWEEPNITFVPTVNGYRVRGGFFKANVNTDNISVEYINRSGTRFRMRLDKIGGVVPVTPSSITIENGYITWHDVAPDVDIQLQFRPARMEWFKRMKTSSAARQFNWTIQEDVGNTDKFNGDSTGIDNENKLGGGDQRVFKATTTTNVIGTSNGVITSRFREVWDGSVEQPSPETRIKEKVFNPIYPVLLDAAVSVDITSNLDDGEENNYGYWAENTANTNRMIIQPAYGGAYSAAWRFPNVTVPKDATINTATLDLNKLASGTHAITAVFYGEDVDDASAFTSGQGGTPVTGMTKTTAKTTQSSGWDNTGNLSVNVKTIIEELTTRAGWASGQAIRIAIPTAETGTGLQYIEDYSRAGSPVVAQLNIDYTVGGSSALLLLS